MPRLVVPAEENVWDFTDDSRSIWGQNCSDEDLARWAATNDSNAESAACTGRFRVRSIVDGSSAAIPNSTNMQFVDIAPDGREILIHEVENNKLRDAPTVFDVSSGQKFDLPVHPNQCADRARFTPDGRFIVYYRDKPVGEGEFVWLGRSSRKIVHSVPNAAIGAIAASGRWICQNENGRCRICEAGSDRVLIDLWFLPPGCYPEFLPNEDFLIVRIGNSNQIVQVSNPAFQLLLSLNQRILLLPDAMTLVTTDSDTEFANTRTYDLRTGKITHSREYPAKSFCSNGISRRIPCHARTIMASNRVPSLLDRVLARIPRLGYLVRDTGYVVVTNVLTGDEDFGIRTDGQAYLSPDGQTIAIHRSSGDLEFWDIPAPRSRKWVAGGMAAGSALVLALARWSKASARRQPVC